MLSDFSVFISHVSEDETIAIAIKHYIEKVFLNAQVFVSGTDLTGGEVWAKEISDKLGVARVIISVITPFSESSPWVLFESGAGFVDSRTIPLCGDGIHVNTLKPPMNLLQARDLSTKGLQKLACDIARRAELREPSEFPGLAEAFGSIEEFIRIRKQATSEDTVERKQVEGPQLKVQVTAPESNCDPEIQEKAQQAERRWRQVLIKNIEKAEKHTDMPSRTDMEKMSVYELSDIVDYLDLPKAGDLRLVTMVIAPPSKWTDVPEDAPRWKKMNTLKRLEEVVRRIEEFEKAL